MTANEPKGIGGWLLFFCFGQVLLAPPQAFQAIFQMWDSIGQHPFPIVRQIANIMAGIIIVVTIYGAIVGILIWKGNKHGRALARQYLLIRIGVAVLVFGSLTAWGYNLMGVPGAKRIALRLISPSALEVGVLLLWFAYFTYSKRVRNTYCAESESGKVDES